jgi:N-dimethylarginine dimethylaminohydrolase
MRFHVRDDTARLIEVAVVRPPRLPLQERLLALAAAGLGGVRPVTPPPDARPAFPYGPADPEAVDYERLCVQHAGLVEVLARHGVEVTELESVEVSPAQFFTRDVAFVIDDVLYVARPARTDRQAESGGLRAVVDRGGTVCWLPNGGIEGGDVLVHPRGVVVGISDRTSVEAVAELARRLRGGPARQVTAVSFAMRGIAHLDLVFNILSPELAVVYRPALTAESLLALSTLFEFIDAESGDMEVLGVNLLSLSWNTVVVSQGATALARSLERRGFTVILVPYDEVAKTGGGIRCSTLPLRRS